MVLSEANATWYKEISKLEKLTGKSITTLQDGIDAINARVEEINNQELLTNADIDALGVLGYYADAIVTIKIADAEHQAFLQKEKGKCIANIRSIFNLLNKN